jgi:hypothetical protein
MLSVSPRPEEGTVTDKEGTADRVLEAASGLYCTTGREVFRRDDGHGVWQSVLPDGYSRLGLEPLECPQVSPDGQHGAFVAVSGAERYVCIVALPGLIVRTAASPLTSVDGMAWSPDGQRLCVVGGDPSVGVLSMDGTIPHGAVPLFSLFVMGTDDPDLVPVTGPIVLAGIPRWSPAGDAVAVVGQEQGGLQVAVVVTMDGREGPLVSGTRVLLGESAWTASGSLLCAVTERDGTVRVQMVDTCTGTTEELGEPWDDVCWLSLVDNRVLVAGRSKGAWIVADVTDGGRVALTPSAASIADVAAGPACLWTVSPVDNGRFGLWSVSLQGDRLRLHVTAPSVRGMRMRQDGTAVAVMAGAAGAETVRVYMADGDRGVELGRRDTIVGWVEEHQPYTRAPRLHYLLTPAFEAVDVESPPELEDNGVTERLELRDVPRPLLPVTVLENVGTRTAAPSGIDDFGDMSLNVPAEVPIGRRQRIGWIAAIVLLTLAVLVVGAIGVEGVHRLWELRAIADHGPDITTPTTPSVVDHTDEQIDTPSEAVIVPDVPAEKPPEPVVEPAEKPVELFGVRIGSWTASTELLRPACSCLVRPGGGRFDAMVARPLLWSGRRTGVDGMGIRRLPARRQCACCRQCGANPRERGHNGEAVHISSTRRHQCHQYSFRCGGLCRRHSNRLHADRPVGGLRHSRRTHRDSRLSSVPDDCGRHKADITQRGEDDLHYRGADAPAGPCPSGLALWGQLVMRPTFGKFA